MSTQIDLEIVQVWDSRGVLNSSIVTLLALWGSVVFGFALSLSTPKHIITTKHLMHLWKWYLHIQCFGHPKAQICLMYSCISPWKGMFWSFLRFIRWKRMCILTGVGHNYGITLGVILWRVFLWDVHLHSRQMLHWTTGEPVYYVSDLLTLAGSSVSTKSIHLEQ